MMRVCGEGEYLPKTPTLNFGMGNVPRAIKPRAMENITTIQQLVTALSGAGAPGSPFVRNEVGTVPADMLGSPKSSNTVGRSYFQVGEFRISVYNTNLNKPQYSIIVLKAAKDIGNMKAGDCFAIAE